MRVCIPTEDDSGFDAALHGHFGSAPCYVLFDSTSGSLETIPNPGRHHAHGTCEPLGALTDAGIDMVLCPGMGRRALTSLESAGIQVYVTGERTVHGALQAARAGAIRPLLMEEACRGRAHSC